MKNKPVYKDQVKVSSTMDWRDAFFENQSEYYIKNLEKVTYSTADAILVKHCTSCSRYSNICAYVSQFEQGGFWLSEEGLFFVTRGVESDKDATYEDAIAFLKTRG